jgi:hypothetical protein
MFRNGQDSDGDAVMENSNNRERAESRVSASPNHSATSKALLSSVALDSVRPKSKRHYKTRTDRHSAVK